MNRIKVIKAPSSIAKEKTEYPGSTKKFATELRASQRKHCEAAEMLAEKAASSGEKDAPVNDTTHTPSRLNKKTPTYITDTGLIAKQISAALNRDRPSASKSVEPKNLEKTEETEEKEEVEKVENVESGEKVEKIVKPDISLKTTQPGIKKRKAEEVIQAIHNNLKKVRKSDEADRIKILGNNNGKHIIDLSKPVSAKRIVEKRNNPLIQKY